MKRFINLGNQIDENEKAFAFFDTVSGEFVHVGGSEVFDDVNDLIECANNNLTPEELQRYLELVPYSYFTPMQAEYYNLERSVPDIIHACQDTITLEHQTREYKMFVDLVDSMRKRQIAYFVTREPSVLTSCKSLEKQVDRVLDNHRQLRADMREIHEIIKTNPELKFPKA